jgi:hypothetical protein
MTQMRDTRNTAMQPAQPETRPENAAQSAVGGAVSPSGPSQSSGASESSSPATIRPAAETTQAQPAVKPAVDSGAQANTDKGRLLPWETPSQLDKTYTVWSSDDASKPD